MLGDNSNNKYEILDSLRLQYPSLDKIEIGNNFISLTHSRVDVTFVYTMLYFYVSNVLFYSSHNTHNARLLH